MRIIALTLLSLAFVGASGCSPTSAEKAANAAAEARHQEWSARNAANDRVHRELVNNDDVRFETEMFRVKYARELRLSDDTPREEILRVVQTQNLRAMAREYGLPETASEGQIWDAYHDRQSARWRADRIKGLGLPANATDEQIRAREDDRDRKDAALNVGLPETATWEQIRVKWDDNDRRRTARRYDLPETASWAVVEQAIKDRQASPESRAQLAQWRRESAERRQREKQQAAAAAERHRIQAVSRGLPATATREDFEALEVERVRVLVTRMLNLPETAGWGAIYDATQNPPPSA